MNNIVIFEGVNKTGKSSIIKMLNELIPDSIVFYDRTVRDRYAKTFYAKMAMNAQLMTMTQMFKQVPTDKIILLDRFHLSEYVYGKIERSYDCMKDVLVIDDVLAKMGAKIIYMEDNIDGLNDRCGKDMTRYKEEYELILNCSSCMKSKINYEYLTRTTLQHLVDIIEDKGGIYNEKFENKKRSIYC